MGIGTLKIKITTFFIDIFYNYLRWKLSLVTMYLQFTCYFNVWLDNILNE